MRFGMTENSNTVNTADAGGKPLISVLLPVYNAQKYVESAVRSILTQTLADFEFIIINDGSKDRSREILESLAAQDKRIRLVSRENRGIVATLNEGLELARGEFVARMDADDLAMPERFERQVDFMRRYPLLAACGTAVMFIDPDGEPIAPKANMKLQAQDVDAALMRGEWPVVHPSIMMRTQRVRAIGGYREYATWEDHDLFLRLGEAGGMANIPEILLKYRLHLQSIVHSRTDTKGETLTRLIRDAYQRRNLPMPADAQMPQYSVQTVAEHQRSWAWWALAAGNKAAARKHAWGAVCKDWFSTPNWRALACALRGH